LEQELKDVFDMYEFSEEQRQEIQDRELIQQIRNDTLDFLSDRYPEYFKMGGSRAQCREVKSFLWAGRFNHNGMSDADRVD
jgi:hypothetical protein